MTKIFLIFRNEFFYSTFYASIIFFYILFYTVPIKSCLLFKRFPELATKIPYISLCDVPTPIIKAGRFAHKIGYPCVYIKRDDLTGKIVDDQKLYGGNKPRKLEWLLADALQKNAKTVITYGCVGSNHALATAVYAKQVNMNAILMLIPQPNSHIVRQNLLLDYHAHAQLRLFPDTESRDKACQEIRKHDAHAYFIPTGGSNAVGTLGFVNAAYELQEQIQAGIIPEPDIIYVPIGSCATTAGLLLGLEMCNAKTRIVAVAVQPEEGENFFEKKTQEFFRETNLFLHNLDGTISLYDFPSDRLLVNKKFWGTAYGAWELEDILAIKIIKELEGITLEGTYSSKSICAVIDDVVHNRITNETVLIWNTYCGLDFTSHLQIHSYTQLPDEFHEYFEYDVQLLNRLLD